MFVLDPAAKSFLKTGIVFLIIGGAITILSMFLGLAALVAGSVVFGAGFGFVGASIFWEDKASRYQKGRQRTCPMCGKPLQ